MAEVDYTPLAEADLLEIARFTQHRWDDEQAARYLDLLEGFCMRLAEFPTLGRSTDDIRPGLLRMRCESHVVYYEVSERGILVARILHKSMQPNLHEF